MIECNHCANEEFEEPKQIYDFTFVDESGEITSFYKEVEPIQYNISDMLFQFKAFLNACGYEVSEVIVKNSHNTFSSKDI